MNKIPKYKTKNNISQEKLKFSNKDSNRKFGDDISAKIKNSISPNIIHNPKNRKSLSNIDEKVNK